MGLASLVGRLILARRGRSIAVVLVAASLLSAAAWVIQRDKGSASILAVVDGFPVGDERASSSPLP